MIKINNRKIVKIFTKYKIFLYCPYLYYQIYKNDKNKINLDEINLNIKIKSKLKFKLFINNKYIIINDKIKNPDFYSSFEIPKTKFEKMFSEFIEDLILKSKISDSFLKLISKKIPKTNFLDDFKPNKNNCKNCKIKCKFNKNLKI